MDKKILNNIRAECVDALKREPDRVRALAVLKKYNTDVFEAIRADTEDRIGDALLVAMGSFSRMLLTPYSDIDLLVIHKRGGQPDENIRRLIYGFYDTDFDITISTRTIEETIDVSRYSYKTLFSVFEPLYVAGSHDLFEKLVTKFGKKIKPNDHIKNIVDGLFFDAEKRLKTNNNILVPNLKESPGALRELSVSMMLCRIFRMRFNDAVIHERDYIYLIRSYLHAFSGRLCDVLNEEVAEETGKLLGLGESELRRNIILSLRNGLVLYRGILSDIKSGGDRFWASAALKRFSDTAVKGRDLQFFLSSRNSIDEAFWTRELHNEIPEFAFIEGMVERIGFHVMPVDEHSIQVIREFYKLMSGEECGEYKLIKDIALSLDQQDREILLMAMLFHDIGKGRGGGHSQKGRLITAGILKRYSLPDSVIESVLFLIENHLLIYIAMTRRDIENIDVITEMALKVDGIANLDKLCVLAFCDMKATNPTGLNSWNLELLKILYYRIKKHIEGDRSYIKPENISLWAKDNRKKYPDELDNIICNLPAPYLRYHSHVEIYDTAMLLNNMFKSGTIQISFEPKTMAGYALLRIAMPGDTPGIFHKINSVLSYFGASVIYASVHTMKNGAVFDLFRVGGSVIYNRVRMKRLREKLTDVLFEREKANPPVCGASFTPPVKSNVSVKFENSHNTYTQLEIECNDRNNLLTDISGIFVEHNLNITFAKISTFGRLAVDTFHISKNDRHLDEGTMAGLKLRLEQTL
ncbi:MAG: HD domain-containing protein [Oligoflexia bacterium]|nr:HD domain-containing protein [Oligoflexia bacterium]